MGKFELSNCYLGCHLEAGLKGEVEVCFQDVVVIQERAFNDVLDIQRRKRKWGDKNLKGILKKKSAH